MLIAFRLQLILYIQYVTDTSFSQQYSRISCDYGNATKFICNLINTLALDYSRFAFNIANVHINENRS